MPIGTEYSSCLFYSCFKLISRIIIDLFSQPDKLFYKPESRIDVSISVRTSEEEDTGQGHFHLLLILHYRITVGHAVFFIEVYISLKELIVVQDMIGKAVFST